MSLLAFDTEVTAGPLMPQRHAVGPSWACSPTFLSGSCTVSFASVSNTPILPSATTYSPSLGKWKKSGEAALRHTLQLPPASTSPGLCPPPPPMLLSKPRPPSLALGLTCSKTPELCPRLLSSPHVSSPFSPGLLSSEHRRTTL